MRLVGAPKSRRRAIVVTLAWLLVLLVLGDVAPRAVLYYLHVGATDLDMTTRLVDPEARLDPRLAGAERLPLEVTTQIASAPAQTDPEDPGTKKKGSAIIADREIRAGEEVLARLADRLVLERSSALPSAYPTSALEIALPEAGYRQATGEFLREGAGYAFPPETEKRSYPFFDPWLMDFAYLDYRGEAPADPTEPDMLAFVFGQRVPGHRLRDTLEALGTPKQEAAKTLDVTGPAGRWYSAEDLASRGLSESQQVTLEPFYAVDREVKVEPQSGRILNVTERINVYLATSTDPAEFADGTRASGAHRLDRVALEPGGPRGVEQLAAARIADPGLPDGKAAAEPAGYDAGLRSNPRILGGAEGPEVALPGLKDSVADARVRADGPRTLIGAELSWDPETRAAQRDQARAVIDTRRALAAWAWFTRVLMAVVAVVGIRTFLRRGPR